MKKHFCLILELAAGLVAATVPALAGAAPTPEPATILLMGGGIGALILVARWKRSQK